MSSDLIPLGGTDIIVSLEPMEALRYLPYLSEEGWIVTNTNPFVNIPNYPAMESVEKELAAHSHTVDFDMDSMAKEMGSPRSSNMILLGAASPFIHIDADKIEAAIRKVFSAKGEKITELNVEAFRLGRNYSLENINGHASN